MIRHRISTLAVLLAVTGIVTAPAWASFGHRERPERKGPPQEAIDACKEKSEGAHVEIVTPRGNTIKATCKLVDGQLAAVPDGGVRGTGKGGPPQGGEN